MKNALPGPRLGTIQGPWNWRGAGAGGRAVLFRQKDSVQDDLFPGSKAPKASYEQGLAEFGERRRVGKKSSTWRGSHICLSQRVCQVSSCVTLGWGGVRLASVCYFSSQKRLGGLDVREGTQSKGLPARQRCDT